MTCDVVEVWLIRTDLPERVVSDLLALLDDGERERADALRYPDSRRQFIAAHGAFRVILGRRLGVPPASLRWQLGPHGKPELAGPWPSRTPETAILSGCRLPGGRPPVPPGADPIAQTAILSGPHVSFSRSGDLAALAMCARRRVGVDIQQLLPAAGAARLAARFYPRQEAGLVAAAARPARQAACFTRLWARKEACVKITGGPLMPGLGKVIPRTGVVAGGHDGTSPGPCLVRDVRAPRGYRAAVAAEGADAFDVIRRWARPLRRAVKVTSGRGNPLGPRYRGKVAESQAPHGPQRLYDRHQPP